MILIIILLFLGGIVFGGTTHTAISCEYSEVSSKVSGAADGDTVTVPAGTCTWTTMLTIPEGKGVTLIGAGPTQTILSSGLTFVTFYGSRTRVSGFKFYGSSANVNAFITAYGNDWVIDNNVFDGSLYYAANGTGTNGVIASGSSVSTIPSGVIANNTFLETKVLSDGRGASAAYMQRQNNGWATVDALGDVNQVYVEDNIISKHSGNPIDGNYGGRYVFRYNLVDSPNTLVHGIQGINRGNRSWEIYGNDFNRTLGASNQYTQLRARAGTGHIYFNYIRGQQQSTTYIQIDNNRTCVSTCDGACATGGPGMCDGTSYWDGNTDATGYPCRDQIGRRSDSSLWSTYSITSCADNGSGKVRITSAGHDLLITDKAMIISSSNLAGCATNIIGIHTILAVDTNTFDVDLSYSGEKSGTGFVMGHPPGQILDPAYQWKNYFEGTRGFISYQLGGYCAAESDHIKENRDYYNYNVSFNGSSGVGMGTLANRPETCTTGTGYWSTSQDTSDITKFVGVSPETPISGTLYTCTSTNTWSSTYAPYAYPHPLRGVSVTGTGSRMRMRVNP